MHNAIASIPNTRLASRGSTRNETTKPLRHAIANPLNATAAAERAITLASALRSPRLTPHATNAAAADSSVNAAEECSLSNASIRLCPSTHGPTANCHATSNDNARAAIAGACSSGNRIRQARIDQVAKLINPTPISRRGSCQANPNDSTAVIAPPIAIATPHILNVTCRRGSARSLTNSPNAVAGNAAAVNNNDNTP